jgi:hypothetical protein
MKTVAETGDKSKKLNEKKGGGINQPKENILRRNNLTR